MKNPFAPITIVSFFFLSTFYLTADAQKPPSEQKVSVRAPANIKIDGKATEWNNKFQAYSYHTQFYYTISNDDKYLYLTVQATDWIIISRIFNGGITFTINKSDTKKDPEGIHLTYPVIQGFLIAFKRAPKIEKGSPAYVVDSFVNVQNYRMEQRSKFIKVVGVKDVDTTTSIYNLDGIKTAATIDNKYRYTYELAISLIDLGLSADTPTKFTYQVMINEVEPEKHAPGEIYATFNLPGIGEQYATDFWGEYTLAK
ncbi:MAG: hypothetical protein V4560_11895 [Bacteroidota bacterium]